MFALGWIVVRSASLVRLLQHFHSHIAVSGSHGVAMRGMCQYVHSVIMHASQNLIASTEPHLRYRKIHNYSSHHTHTHVNDLQRHLLVTRKIGSGVQGVWGCIFREGNAVGTHF